MLKWLEDGWEMLGEGETHKSPNGCHSQATHDFRFDIKEKYILLDFCHLAGENTRK